MRQEKLSSMGDKVNQSDVHLRLYRAILIAGASLSAISITGNYIANFPFIVNFKWIALFLISTIVFLFLNNKKYTSHLMFGVFIFLICIFIPFGFVDSGGSQNNTIGYIFLYLITATYLFMGWRRIFLVAMLIVVFIALHTLEFYFPELIAVHPQWNQFIDRMIQIPLLIIASFLILLRFAKEYERVNQKLFSLANYDELTGLCNRRRFNKAMEETAESMDKSIHLALLDLDNFKKINDNHGHHTGDEVLKELARLLKNNFDLDRHIVSRWGGDEFAIIYYGQKNELIRRLDDITDSFHTYVTTYEATTAISTSVVSFIDYEIKPDALLAADHLLYAEKTKKKLDQRYEDSIH